MNNKSDKYKKSLEETYDQTTLYTQEINDSTLDTKLSSKQSVRAVLQNLISEYHGTREQLLWTKWGQGIPRSESRSLIADLSAARIEFISYFLNNVAPSGWTTLTILISLFSGIQLLFLGVIGEYIGSIFEEVKQRPLYIIEDKINIK